MPLMILQQLKKNWKLFTILFLLSVLGFGGWYCTYSKADLKNQVLSLQIQVEESKSNEEILRNAIDDYIKDLNLLESSNKVLENNVKTAQEKILELEAKEPEIVTIKVLPKECQDKLKWLKSEVLKFKDSK